MAESGNVFTVYRTAVSNFLAVCFSVQRKNNSRKVDGSFFRILKLITLSCVMEYGHALLAID